MNNPLRFTDPSGYMTADEFYQIVGDLWNRPKGGYWKRGMSSPHYFHGSEDMDYASYLISRGGGYWRQSTSISGGFRRLPATVTGRANGKSGRVVHPIVWTPLNSSPGEWFFISTRSVHNNEMNDFWVGADDGVFMGDGRIGGGKEENLQDRTLPPRINPYGGSIVDQIVKWMEFIQNNSENDYYLDDIVSSSMFRNPHNEEPSEAKDTEDGVLYWIKDPKSSSTFYDTYPISHIKYDPDENTLSLMLMQSHIRSYEGPRVVFIKSNDPDIIWKYYCFINHIQEK